MAVMTRRRRSAPPRRAGGSPFTVLAYFSVLMAALVLCGVIGPGRMWRRSGLRKEYRAYQVLELPVPREEIVRGALAGDGTEVPVPHQKLMKSRRLSLEEYARWLQSYRWEGSHLRVSQGGVRYQIYYIPAGEETARVPIPVGYEYALSGDGQDGFIVTIWEETT